MEGVGAGAAEATVFFFDGAFFDAAEVFAGVIRFADGCSAVVRAPWSSSITEFRRGYLLLQLVDLAAQLLNLGSQCAVVLHGRHGCALGLGGRCRGLRRILSQTGRRQSQYQHQHQELPKTIHSQHHPLRLGLASSHAGYALDSISTESAGQDGMAHPGGIRALAGSWHTPLPEPDLRLSERTRPQSLPTRGALGRPVLGTPAHCKLAASRGIKSTMPA